MHTPNLKVKGDEMSVGYLLFMQLETDSLDHCLPNVRYENLRHHVVLHALADWKSFLTW